MSKKFLFKELEHQHMHIITDDDDMDLATEHTKLSVQFAIEILEEIQNNSEFCRECDYGINVDSKIQELKQYLDE